jgi:Flp pilus assembly protein protease CpaA
MYELVFLVVLGLVYLVFASASDLKKREVANWLVFSLAIFAIVYRAFYAFFYSDYSFLFNGLIGLGIFIVLGYSFYYARLFGGGDAKLLMALGAILPFSNSIIINIYLFFSFIFIFFLFGSVWGIVYSFYSASLHYSAFFNEFKKQFVANRKSFIYSIVIAVLSFLVLFAFNYFIGGFEILQIFPILILVFPLLYVYAKSVEEACFIVSISPNDLTIGDWLYEKVKVGKKFIKPNWEGLDEKELEILRKLGKKIKVKYGIPFVPSFLFAFIAYVFLFIYFKDILVNLMGLVF